MSSEKPLFVVTQRRCVSCLLLLAVPIIFICIREIEYHEYDLTSTEQLPAAIIELPPNLANNHFQSQRSINLLNINANNKNNNNTVIIDTKSNDENSSNIDINLTNTSSSSSSFKSYRSYDDKVIAFKKFLNGTGKIIIIHQRKSGGTTLENWFNAINSQLRKDWDANHKIKWNSSVECREAYHFFHKILENNITWSFLIDPYSIYVTSMRHPITRILSQYEFEWRWGCQRCDYQHGVELYKYSQMTDWSFMSRSGKLDTKYIEDKQFKIKKYAVLDFNDWLNRLITFEIKNHNLGKPKHTMQSVRSMYINNYFLWISCCPNRWCSIQRDYIENNDKNKIIQCFHKSIQILKSFDIILITEWMNDLRSQLYVNQLFFNDTNIEHESHFIGMDRVNKPYPHSVTNRGKNYMISPENEEILYKLNNWDLKVYQYAKQVSFDRIHTVWNDVFDPKDDNAFNELLYNKKFQDLLNVTDDLQSVFSPYKELSYS